MNVFHIPQVQTVQMSREGKQTCLATHPLLLINICIYYTNGSNVGRATSITNIQVELLEPEGTGASAGGERRRRYSSEFPLVLWIRSINQSLVQQAHRRFAVICVGQTARLYIV